MNPYTPLIKLVAVLLVVAGIFLSGWLGLRHYTNLRTTVETQKVLITSLEADIKSRKEDFLSLTQAIAKGDQREQVIYKRLMNALEAVDRIPDDGCLDRRMPDELIQLYHHPSTARQQGGVEGGDHNPPTPQ